MRFSNYNILSAPLLGGGYALCNSLSGAIELISSELYELIINIGSKNIEPAELAFSQELIDSYLQRGILTEMSIEEETEVVRSAANVLAESDDTYSIIIIPNLNCNYRCTYCYELDSPFFKSHNHAFISSEQLDGVFNFISKHKIKREITLFGGEPLRRENYHLVEEIISRLGGGYEVSAVTNGHDLDSFIPLLGKDKISRLQITVDGPKHIHDKRRISMDRESSYDHIFANLPAVLEVDGVSVSLRINVDNRNVEFLGNLFDDIIERKLDLSDRLEIYTSKVTGLDPSLMDETMLDKALAEWGRKYPFLIVDAEEQRIEEWLSTALQSATPVKRGGAFCGAVSNTLIFAPDGNVYSCIDVVGRQEKACGNYTSDGDIIWDQDKKAFWDNGRLEHREYCLRCKFALFCKGGCYLQALCNKNLASPRSCRLYQERFPVLLSTIVEGYIQQIEEIHKIYEEDTTITKM
jgi:uncharacterized protein